MDDDIAGINEDPIAIRHAFNPQARVTFGFELFDQLIGNSANMAVGASRRNDHRISECCFTGEID